MKCLNSKLAIVAHFVLDFLHLKYRNADTEQMHHIGAKSNCTVLDVIFHTLLILLSSDIQLFWDYKPNNNCFLIENM